MPKPSLKLTRYDRRQRMRPLALPLALLVSLPSAIATPLPFALAEALRGTTLRGEPTSWCRLGTRPQASQAFAVLVSKPAGGEYVIVERRHPPLLLAAFEGKGELSCHTPRQARQLGASIARSETVRGAVQPKWNTTVICGFTRNTEAVCWQYAPALQRFERVGGWVT